MTITIRRESPAGADLTLLFERHTADMHADTPPESIHMMDASELDIPEVSFFVMRDAGEPVAMGAFKRIGEGHGEIKSMHVLVERRGQGLSRRMLDHLLSEARAAGLTRLSLETGSQAMFEPARVLYARAGFEECGPFEGYVPDPNSIFMTRSLA
ncbi:GNAT family N-acetyltransferase [Tabrizicola sp. J26]|uniref:GNAT family N-acetyltransferase n=1 Tax=Alitabrizicola rongguiensis TaxID=2909234 RepID=UPI001F41615C|nr:GNAT family N-acetyltransferase [Tabrizicola rongguiensis]MCF1708793.1 GNAT family N-acetyltransferase [Tabrizicola rongguiensis]